MIISTDKFLIEGRLLKFQRREIIFDYSIEKVVAYKEIYLILLKSDERKKNWGQSSNLYAIDDHLKVLWQAELPTTNTGDAYHFLEIVDDQIEAYSWCSYDCIVNPDSGKIIEKKFVK